MSSKILMGRKRWSPKEVAAAYSEVINQSYNMLNGDSSQREENDDGLCCNIIRFIHIVQNG